MQMIVETFGGVGCALGLGLVFFVVVMMLAVGTRPTVHHTPQQQIPDNRAAETERYRQGYELQERIRQEEHARMTKTLREYEYWKERANPQLQPGRNDGVIMGEVVEGRKQTGYDYNTQQLGSGHGRAKQLPVERRPKWKLPRDDDYPQLGDGR